MDDFLDGVDDRLVAGAAAVVARDMRANFVPARFATAAHEVLGGEQHAGRTEAALERVALVEGALQALELLRVGEALDRLDGAAVGLHGEHQAAAHDVAVHAHGAGAAYAVLAAEVRAGEAELLAQEIDEMQARLDA